MKQNTNKNQTTHIYIFSNSLFFNPLNEPILPTKKPVNNGCGLAWTEKEGGKYV